MCIFNMKGGTYLVKRNTSISLLVINVSFIITMGLIFLLYQATIAQSLADENLRMVLLITSMRIGLMAIISFLTYYSWTKQKESYLSDIPFLMAMFFLMVMFGKIVDLFQFSTGLYLTEEELLFHTKMRFILAVFTVVPLLVYDLSLLFFWMSLKDKYKKLDNKKFENNLRFVIITLFCAGFTILILITPTITGVQRYLPIFLYPALLITALIFYTAWKLDRLAKIRPGLLSLAFFLYMVTNALRPYVFTTIFGFSAEGTLYSDLCDMSVFILMFIALVKKHD